MFKNEPTPDRRKEKIAEALSVAGKTCLACGHDETHDRTEYEDTHDRCSHVEKTKERGDDCGHKRYSSKCEDENEGLACWSYGADCECSSEDREIAALVSLLSRREKEHAEELRKAREEAWDAATASAMKANPGTGAILRRENPYRAGS